MRRASGNASVEVDELHCDTPDRSDRLVDGVALSLLASDSAATS